uniref:Uncharacterized protein n=1 Tax=Arundo donax TaxID=35708 RepID=A0A0A8Z4B6_ARUDO
MLVQFTHLVLHQISLIRSMDTIARQKE